MDEEKLLDWEDNVENLPFYKHMIAGSIAGVVEHSIGFPFDTLRTLAQAESTKLTHYKETTQFVRRVGFMSLWKGVTTVIYGCIPAHALYFSVYESSKKFLEIDTDNNFHIISTSITGIVATASHDCIMTPMDVVKQRIQLNRELSPLKMMNHIIQTEGKIGLYRSLPITLIMNVPQAALFMTIYENLKGYLMRDSKGSMLGYFSCAGLAGAISAGITTPMDVIKTRLQTQNEQSSMFTNISPSETATPSEPQKKSLKSRIFKRPRYWNISDTVMTILKEEGFSAFYRGVVPRMLLFLPGAAVSWSSYEYIKILLS